MLELPPHILELEGVVSIVELSCTSWKTSIWIFRQTGTPEIGGSD